LKKDLFYTDDLAYIHDAGFGEFALKSAPGLLNILRQRKIFTGRVVDLGCGCGLWARELTQAGYDVLGIDQSGPMIEIAQKKAPKARFKKESFLNIKLPSCDAVTSLGECFNYLFDKKDSKKELALLFSRVYNALRPGGLFIFDIIQPGQVTASTPSMRHSQGQDWAILLQVEEDFKKGILTRQMTIFRKAGKLYRRSEETHRLQLYKGSEIAAMLRRIGFKVRVSRGYGKLRFRKAHVGFIACKP